MSITSHHHRISSFRVHIVSLLVQFEERPSEQDGVSAGVFLSPPPARAYILRAYIFTGHRGQHSHSASIFHPSLAYCIHCFTRPGSNRALFFFFHMMLLLATSKGGKVILSSGLLILCTNKAYRLHYLLVAARTHDGLKNPYIPLYFFHHTVDNSLLNMPIDLSTGWGIAYRYLL